MVTVQVLFSSFLCNNIEMSYGKELHKLGWSWWIGNMLFQNMSTWSMSLIFWMLRLFSYFWLQESEFPNREPGTAMNENPHSGMQTVRPGSFLGFRNASGMGEPAHTLQQIWFSKGTRNDSISLMSAIFADCRQDFYTLLSTHERCPKEPSSING